MVPCSSEGIARKFDIFTDGGSNFYSGMKVISTVIQNVYKRPALYTNSKGNCLSK